MTVETEVVGALTSDLVSQPVSLFNRSWPPAAVGIAVLITWRGWACSDTDFSS
jgi:hypothetical protein